MRVAPIDMPLIAAEAQRLWDVPHATWFTMMGVGGGVFLLSRLLGLEGRLGAWLGLPVVDVLSFVVIAIGGVILIQHLGRPLRFMFTLLRPQSSWISRGALADFVFLLLGGVLVLPDLRVGAARPLAWLPWTSSPANGVGKAIEVIALLSAAIVIFYAGQVLADSTAIPYWRAPAIPVQFTLSSLAISIGVVMLLETIAGAPIGTRQFWLSFACLALLLAAIIRHLVTRPEMPGKAESLELLVHGRFSRAFLGGVVVAGTVVPMVLALVGVAAPSLRDALGIASLACTLPGGFALRLITLRVGVHAPIHAAIYPPRR
jgi:formate-dependent nitrite reductase membrane component NrfD